MCPNGNDTRLNSSFFDVDRNDVPVGDLRTDYAHVQLVWKVHICRKGSLTAHQRTIF
jgi:hypothetical protein